MKSDCIWRSYYYTGTARIAMREESDQGMEVYYILTDHLGSTSLTYRKSDGQVTTQKYKPWGEARGGAGVLPTDRTFQGQREPGWGLKQFGARWFDSTLGRFAQADSIIPGAGNPLAWDRYAGLGNNPVRYTDPTGHFTDEELEAMFGEDWYDYIINNFSSDLIAILLRDETQVGDLITYEIDDVTYQAVFVLGKDGKLAMWDVNARSATTLQAIDKNPIVGLYSRNSGSDNEYSLVRGFSGSPDKNLSLPGDWRYGENEMVGFTTKWSIDKPDWRFWVGIGIGAVGLPSPEFLGKATGVAGIIWSFASLANVTIVDKVATEPVYPPPWCPAGMERYCTDPEIAPTTQEPPFPWIP